MQELINYLKHNRIQFTELSPIKLQIDGKVYCLVSPDEDDKVLFDEDFRLIADEDEECDRFCFCFGGNWYYEEKKEINQPKLNELKYLGVADLQLPTECFLGIHGGYELLNGSRLYKDWIKKAKFLGCKSLGICEKNTLAGTMKFQLECQKAGIKPILGATYTVFRESEDYRYDITLFTKNDNGWRNLLLINKEVKVVNKNFIIEDVLFALVEDLFVVIDPKSISFEKITKKLKQVINYYNFDTVEYESEERNDAYFSNLIKFFKSDINPICISDAYYLEKEDARIKKKLNQISGTFEYAATNQHFKTKEEYYNELYNFFDESDIRLDKLFEQCLVNERTINKQCNFSIDTSQRHLPKYEMTNEQKLKYETNEELFLSIVWEGFNLKCPKGKEKEYRDRINTEIEVIGLVNGANGSSGLDYFLILWDIIRYCDENSILHGHSRGSSAGSLIAFLTNITQIDPIKWDLLFERFLNKGRASVSIPDIDIDLQPSKKEEVKKYIRSKYGFNQFCYIGTYTTLQLKAALKDLSKLENVSFMETNLISKKIDFDDAKSTYLDLFKSAAKSKELKKFLCQYPDIVDNIKLILGQPKSKSIHACATLIFPKEKEIYEWIPVRLEEKDGEQFLVSEWEGTELEKAGFLKEDILVIEQLDKYANIISTIKKESGKEIDIFDMNLEDENIFEFFQKGLTSDIFQFGTPIFKQYLKKLHPDNIHELIDAVALIRPGAMEVNSHNEYVLRKHGERDTEYKFGTEEITKKTKGLIITQEQVMQLCQSLGGFSLIEADDVRKAIGKKIDYLMQEQKVKFLNGANKNGCPIDEAEDIWHDIEVHGSYSFNKCISGDESFDKPSIQKKQFHPTIGEMYKIANDSSYAKLTGHSALQSKYRRYGYGITFSLDNENRLVYNKIKDIRYEGKKEVYRVTTETGKTIDTTLNHKFPTTNGDKMLEDIDIFIDRIYIKGDYEKGRCDYIFNIEGNNLPKKGERGFQKRDTEYTRLLELSKKIRKCNSNCQICSSYHNRLEIHHKDGNHGNSDENNLILVCPSCHKKEHYRKHNRVKAGEKGLLSETEYIKSIEFLKIDEVYDVEMEAPYHNFLTKNKIITSNSHSVGYTNVSYVGMYFKVYYPLAFWIASFTADENNKHTAEYISEIYKTGNISLFPPNINVSGEMFTPNFKDNCIYWSLSSIKQCGDKAVGQLFEEREQNGEYFSFNEFLTRNVKKGSKVTKQAVENLIYCGAFDEIECVHEPKQRIPLIDCYREFGSVKIDNTKDILSLGRKDAEKYNWWWSLQQKRLCGFAFFDYMNLCNNYLKTSQVYFDFETILQEDSKNSKIQTGGYVNEVIERNSKKGKYCDIVLEQNYQFLTIRIWADDYRVLERQLFDIEKKLLLVTGKVNFDAYKNSNVLSVTKDSQIIILN